MNQLNEDILATAKPTIEMMAVGSPSSNSDNASTASAQSSDSNSSSSSSNNSNNSSPPAKAKEGRDKPAVVVKTETPLRDTDVHMKGADDNINNAQSKPAANNGANGKTLASSASTNSAMN